jgi:transposase
MGNIKVQIKLSRDDRTTLREYISSGTHSAKLIRRAQVILALDTSYGRVPGKEQQIAESMGVSRQTVQVIKNDFLQRGMDSFLIRKRRVTPPNEPKVDGNLEAHIIAICCGEPPKGYERWTLRLIASKCVELGYIESISHMTVKRTLKKTNLSLT